MEDPDGMFRLYLAALSLLWLIATPFLVLEVRKLYRERRFGGAAYHAFAVVGFSLVMSLLWTYALTGIDLRDYVGIAHV